MAFRPVAVLLVASIGVAVGCGGQDQNESRIAQTEMSTIERPTPTPRPVQTEPVTPPPDYGRQAEREVRSYFGRLNRREFEGAWDPLSAALQCELGPYETWLAGYDLTEGTDPTVVSVASATASSAVVQVTLATDGPRRVRRPCPATLGWIVVSVWDSGEWKPAAIQLHQTGGGDPVRDPAECLDYAPVDIPWTTPGRKALKRTEARTPGRPRIRLRSTSATFTPASLTSTAVRAIRCSAATVVGASPGWIDKALAPGTAASAR